jgi:hypothetical protein
MYLKGYSIMKRSFILAMLLSVALTGTAWAQDYVLLPSIGVRGGINLPYQRFSPANGTSRQNITDGAAAVTAEFALWHPEDYWSTLSVKTDLMYVRTGGKFRQDQSIETDRVDELRFAPMLMFRWTTHAPAPFIEGGPFVGYDVSNKFTRTGSIGGQNVTGSGDISDWRKDNFGLDAGAGFGIPTPAGKLSIDGRYSWGLVNKFNGNGNLKRHTNGVLVMAGYDFNFPGSH